MGVSNWNASGWGRFRVTWNAKWKMGVKWGSTTVSLLVRGATIGSELFGSFSIIYRICLETSKERPKNKKKVKNKLSKAKSTNLNGHLFLNRAEPWRSEPDIWPATTIRLWPIPKLKMVDMLTKVAIVQNWSRQTTLGHFIFGSHKDKSNISCRFSHSTRFWNVLYCNDNLQLSVLTHMKYHFQN